jgi:hypothetical protein
MFLYGLSPVPDYGICATGTQEQLFPKLIVPVPCDSIRVRAELSRRLLISLHLHAALTILAALTRARGIDDGERQATNVFLEKSVVAVAEGHTDAASSGRDVAGAPMSAPAFLVGKRLRPNV